MHECPDCYVACYCRGDIDDMQLDANEGDGPACTHPFTCMTTEEPAPECPHVSYSEQAGGWTLCDDCGKDITARLS